jgi:UDP-N-acetylmuramoyl-L-alanyl-D-glutamate--2,6-diaminopimelate ligase
VALEALFGALRGMHPQRILAVFGAAGNRDRGKRSEMAEIVARYADLVLLTNEDPFTEDPERIFADLEVGLRRAGCVRKQHKELTADFGRSCMYVKIPDRREAIRTALALAREGDIVVATGKGAEETMRFRDRTVPWSDRRVFAEELKKPRHG